MNGLCQDRKIVALFPRGFEKIGCLQLPRKQQNLTVWTNHFNPHCEFDTVKLAHDHVRNQDVRWMGFYGLERV